MTIKLLGALFPQTHKAVSSLPQTPSSAPRLSTDGFQQRQITAGLGDQAVKGNEIKQLTQQLAPGMNALEKASVTGDLKEVAGLQKENSKLLGENAQLAAKAQQGGLGGIFARKEMRENNKEILENHREIRKEQGEALGKLRHEVKEQQGQGIVSSLRGIFGL